MAFVQQNPAQMRTDTATGAGNKDLHKACLSMTQGIRNTASGCAVKLVPA